MKLKPIHYTYENRQANRAGLKTMTRRLFHSLKGFGEITEFGPSDMPGYDWHFRDKQRCWNDISTERLLECARYQVGDILYMHEPIEFVSFNGVKGDIAYIRYLDDNKTNVEFIPSRVKFPSLGKWKGRTIPPEWSRPPYYRVTSVGCEQLQSISEEDAKREGVWGKDEPYQGVGDLPSDRFRRLWDSIHKKKHPWKLNEWVFPYGYEEMTDG